MELYPTVILEEFCEIKAPESRAGVNLTSHLKGDIVPNVKVRERKSMKV